MTTQQLHDESAEGGSVTETSDPASAIAEMVVDDLIQQGYVLPVDDCDELRHSVACVIGGALDARAKSASAPPEENAVQAVEDA